jgi:hypothetical protein
MRLGGTKARGGVGSDGRYRPGGASSKANPFAALAQAEASPSPPAKLGGSGSPLLKPKSSSLLKLHRASNGAKEDTAEGEAAPSKAPAAKAKSTGPPCKFDTATLDRKINGCLDEYLSIVDLGEVKFAIGEWDHPDATQAFAMKIFSKGVEDKEANRKKFQKLLVDIVGKEGGVPVALFAAAVGQFAAELGELIYDVPKASYIISRSKCMLRSCCGAWLLWGCGEWGRTTGWSVPQECVTGSSAVVSRAATQPLKQRSPSDAFARALEWTASPPIPRARPTIGARQPWRVYRSGGHG